MKGLEVRLFAFAPEIQSLHFISISIPCGKVQNELKDTKETNDDEMLFNIPKLACSVTQSHVKRSSWLVS